MNLIIEDNIPMPGGTTRQKSPLRETIEKLEPGQSFAFPLTEISNVRGCSKRLKPKRFRVLKVSAVEGRIWRKE